MILYKNLPYLDGWRGLAIIFVLLSHFFPNQFSQYGELGVLLFFVLSGFFMSRLLFIKKVSIKLFFARRFSRVIPTFWLFILTTTFYAAYIQPKSYVVPFDEIVDTLIFLRTYFPNNISIWKEYWPIGHLWSLNVEEHSYVYLAIGAILFSKSKNKILPITFLVTSMILVLCTIVFYSVHNPNGATPWILRSECASFGLITSATYNVVTHYYGKSLLPRSSLFPIITFILACLCFSPLAPLAHGNVYRLVAAPLLAASSINHADNFPKFIKYFLSLPVLRWFGICSFSIYLWQQPLYQHSGFSFLRLLIALALGALSFYFFENPLRLFLNKKFTLYKINWKFQMNRS